MKRRMNLNERRFWGILGLGLAALAFYYYLWPSLQGHSDQDQQRPATLTTSNGNLRDQPISSRRNRIPDKVHFFLFDTELPLGFVSATCILAVHLNHRPQSGVVIHTNKNLTSGRYLDIVKSVLGTSLEIRVDPKSRPSHVYGQRLSSTFHATDVARISTLIKEGGVALDLDTFVIKPLRGFFRKDCVIGWPEGQFIGTQIILAKPQDLFMQLWLKTYQDYRPSAWYYNAAEAPTKQILIRKPDLITRVKVRFGVHNLADKLYLEPDFNWSDFYAIHLLSRHRDYLAKKDVEQTKILNFDEFNIQNYTNTFGEMARSIWNHPTVKKHWQ